MQLWSLKSTADELRLEEMQKTTSMQVYMEWLHRKRKKKSNFQKEVGPEYWNHYKIDNFWKVNWVSSIKGN